MKNKFLTALICSACCLSAYAENQAEHKFYLGAEGTYAMSLDANMNVDTAPNSISGSYWAGNSYNGYGSKLQQSLGYGALAGYNLTDIFALELAYNNRPSFKYVNTQIYPGSGNDGIGNRTRYFDLQSQTTMLNGVIHLAPIFNILKTFKNYSNIEPFINLGAGFARNTVTNFHTIGDSGRFSGASYSSMTDKTVYKLAAQAGLGLDYSLNSRWKAKVGYRFIYGGKFTSQNYILDDADNVYSSKTGVAMNPWKGTLKANEVYLGLTYSL